MNHVFICRSLLDCAVFLFFIMCNWNLLNFLPFFKSMYCARRKLSQIYDNVCVNLKRAVFFLGTSVQQATVCRR